MALTVSAANVAKITVTSTGGGSDVLFLVEDTPFTPAYESGADIEKMMNSGQAYSINLYAVSAGKNLSMVATNNLADLALTFKSNANETQYTMTFSEVQGTVKLYDAVTAQEITLANNGSYVFDCTAGATIADRFIINRTAPAAPGICHYGDVLQVTGSNGMTVQINNMDDTQAIAPVAITSDSQDIDISGLTTGNQYKVVWNSQTLIIRK